MTGRVRVALTGGVASGKSTVAAILAELGAVVVDADLLAREVVEPGTPGLAAVVEEFGAEVLAEDGSLDRAALGARRLRRRGRPAPAGGDHAPAGPGPGRSSWRRPPPAGALVVHDIPLLVETGQAGCFDAVAGRRRAGGDPGASGWSRERGWSSEDAEARVAAQADPGAAAGGGDVRRRQHRDARRPP